MNSIATLTRNLAWFHVKKRNYKDAEAYKRKEVEIRLDIANTSGYNQSDLNTAQYGLAKILRKMGKDMESMKYYILARQTKCFGAGKTPSKSKSTMFKP